MDCDEKQQEEEKQEHGHGGQGQQCSPSSETPPFVVAAAPGTPCAPAAEAPAATLIGTDSEESLVFSELGSEKDEDIVAANPGLADAPGYFLAGLQLQRKQTKQTVEGCVKKFHDNQKKRIDKLKHNVAEEFKAVEKKITGVVLEQKATSATVDNLQKQLSLAISRLDKLEAKGCSSAAASTASGGSVSGLQQAPREPEGWDGWQKWLNTSDGGGIDRGRMYGGNCDEAPREEVISWLKAVVTRYNQSEGLNSGFLTVEQIFAPKECVSFWIKFKASLGQTSRDRGLSFKVYCNRNEVKVLDDPNGTNMWIQPNRTEEERSHRNRVNCCLSWLHRIREHCAIDKQWMRGKYLSSVIKGNFKEGSEKAAWKGTVIAKLVGESFELEIDSVLTAAFSADFAAAHKPFDIAAIRKWWSDHLSEWRQKGKFR